MNSTATRGIMHIIPFTARYISVRDLPYPFVSNYNYKGKRFTDRYR